MLRLSRLNATIRTSPARQIVIDRARESMSVREGEFEAARLAGKVGLRESSKIQDR
jgi:hypothetical protein